jgi:hypothetical protein
MSTQKADTVPSKETKTQVAEALREALASFGPNGEKWVNRFPMGDGEYCAITAIPVEEDMPLFDKCLYALGEAIDPANPNIYIGGWNDRPERTFAEVKAVYEKAIAKAETK